MNDNEIISAYHVNQIGVLCYSGLPVDSKYHPDLTIEHHNGKPYGYEITSGMTRRYSYEVGGVVQFGLWHGRPFRKFKND